MSLTSILIPIATEIGATLLARILRQQVGGTAADIGEGVIDAIARKAGVPAEALPDLADDDPDLLEGAMIATETELAAVELGLAEERGRTVRAEMVAPGLLTRIWRPLASLAMVVLLIVMAVAAIVLAFTDPEGFALFAGAGFVQTLALGAFGFITGYGALRSLVDKRKDEP